LKGQDTFCKGRRAHAPKFPQSFEFIRQFGVGYDRARLPGWALNRNQAIADDRRVTLGRRTA
jgi:hypothetical protein